MYWPFPFLPNEDLASICCLICCFAILCLYLSWHYFFALFWETCFYALTSFNVCWSVNALFWIIQFFVNLSIHSTITKGPLGHIAHLKTVPFDKHAFTQYDHTIMFAKIKSLVEIEPIVLEKKKKKFQYCRLYLYYFVFLYPIFKNKNESVLRMDDLLNSDEIG